MIKYIFVVVIFISLNLQAQYNIQVSEKALKFQDGNYNAFVATIYESDKKEVEKLWKKQIKDMHANVSSQKGEMKGDDAKMKSMGENTFDIYSLVTEKEKSIELAVAIDLGGAFLSSSQHSDKAKIISNLVSDFAIKTTKDGIGRIIKKEKKVQEELNKELSDLESKKIKLEKNIENWEKDIEQAKKDILQSEQDQKLKQKEITEQDKVVDAIKAKQKAVK